MWLTGASEVHSLIRLWRVGSRLSRFCRRRRLLHQFAISESARRVGVALARMVAGIHIAIRRIGRVEATAGSVTLTAFWCTRQPALQLAVLVVGNSAMVAEIRTLGERFGIVLGAMHARHSLGTERRRIVVWRIDWDTFRAARVELCWFLFLAFAHAQEQSKLNAEPWRGRLQSLDG